MKPAPNSWGAKAPLDFLSARCKDVGERFANLTLSTPLPKSAGGVPVYRNDEYYCSFVDREHALEFINLMDNTHNPRLNSAIWSTVKPQYQVRLEWDDWATIH